MKRNPLAFLEARAKAGAAKSPRARVVVNRQTPATEGEGGTPAGPVSAELWLYGTVGGYWWGFDSDDVADALRALGDVDEILVRLHSFGGSAIEGIAIANLLANHPANVRIVVDSLAASAASMIALAGAELIMSPGSQLMIHDAWMCTCGNEAELLADAEWIGKQSRNYAETYSHRAPARSADEWREVMRGPEGQDGTWYSAQEAVDVGLASRVDNIASTTPPPAPPAVPEDVYEDLELTAALEWDRALIAPAVRAAWTSQRRLGAPKPPSASAVGFTTQKEENVTTFTDNLRAKLGIAAEDADEATILAALDEVLAEQTTPTPEVPEGMSLVSTEVLTELRAGAEDGRAARAEQRTATRDRAITSAIQTGRIAPSQRDHFTSLYDADPAGTQAILDKLVPGLVPLAELGHDQDDDATADAAFEAAHAALLKQQGITTTKEA